MRTLNEIPVGSSVKIVKVTGDMPTKRRLMDMGLTKNTEVNVLKLAPLGDPIELRVRGYDLSIRKDDAKHIGVEEL
ncbi:MAG: ferrous iron transport protein A [Anaerococcus sp.]|nr:ferrous iron transport protein A [Anaerococcus sp.]MDD7045440.1 ferrous iron transport protein A [Peptoniphilaceae bacterium]MDY2919631.1 ferrous iron transport protein A [Anaerococcus sp.]